jgi:hypothetical protein
MRQGAQRTACERVAQPGDATACRNALTQYCVPEQPPMQPPACAALQRCCGTLTDNSDRMDCDFVVRAADAMVCEVATPTFCAPPNMPTPECSMLEACCGTVQDSSDRRDCEQVFAARDSVVCAAATIAYCSRPEEPPPPPAQCTMLAMCCTRVTNQDDRRECESIVQRADGSDCDDARDEYCEQEPPPGQPDACRNLQMCCADVPNPGDRDVCTRTAMGTDAQACQQQTNRFCDDAPAPSQTNPCQTLSGCCTMLNLFDRPFCDAIVQRGVADECTNAATNYCN